MSVYYVDLKEWALTGCIASASEFVEHPQRHLDTARFQDVCIQIGPKQVFVTNESRFEDLVIEGGHSLDWLLEPSKFPHHHILFATNEDDLLSLTANWCGWIFDETNCPYVVLDSWLYWRLTGGAGHSAKTTWPKTVHQNPIANKTGEGRRERTQGESADIISLNDWRSRKSRPIER